MLGICNDKCFYREGFFRDIVWILESLLLFCWGFV